MIKSLELLCLVAMVVITLSSPYLNGDIQCDLKLRDLLNDVRFNLNDINLADAVKTTTQQKLLTAYDQFSDLQKQLQTESDRLEPFLNQLKEIRPISQWAPEIEPLVARIRVLEQFDLKSVEATRSGLTDYEILRFYWDQISKLKGKIRRTRQIIVSQIILSRLDAGSGLSPEEIRRAWVTLPRLAAAYNSEKIIELSNDQLRAIFKFEDASRAYEEIDKKLLKIQGSPELMKNYQDRMVSQRRVIDLRNKILKDTKNLVLQQELQEAEENLVQNVKVEKALVALADPWIAKRSEALKAKTDAYNQSGLSRYFDAMIYYETYMKEDISDESTRTCCGSGCMHCTRGIRITNNLRIEKGQLYNITPTSAAIPLSEEPLLYRVAPLYGRLRASLF